MKKSTIPTPIQEKMKNYPLFYQKVWTACSTIPKGEVRTYKWIAQKIGHPMAYRAVGTALGANPFVPQIPCHRVVRSDGGMGGYSARGGVQTKRALLVREKALEK